MSDWTTDKPTTGWWWHRFSQQSRQVVKEVTCRDGQMFVRDDDGELWDIPDGEWQPVAPPAD